MSIEYRLDARGKISASGRAQVRPLTRYVRQTPQTPRGESDINQLRHPTKTMIMSTRTAFSNEGSPDAQVHVSSWST